MDRNGHGDFCCRGLCALTFEIKLFLKTINSKYHQEKLSLARLSASRLRAVTARVAHTASNISHESLLPSCLLVISYGLAEAVKRSRL